jgi:hypothetical protein
VVVEEVAAEEGEGEEGEGAPEAAGDTAPEGDGGNASAEE